MVVDHLIPIRISLKMNFQFFISWELVHRLCLPLHRRGSCADLNVPFGVLAPPMLLRKDAVGKDPCSCVDSLEKVTPFKNCHCWYLC